MELLTLVWIIVALIVVYHIFLLLLGTKLVDAVITEPTETTEVVLANGKKFWHWQKSETDTLYREIYQECEYGEACGMRLQKDSTIVDCGANIGMFSVWALEQCNGEAQIHAFEPIPSTYEALRRNAERHGDGRIRAVNVGVSDMEQDAVFEHHPRCSIWSTSDHDVADARRKRVADEFFTVIRGAGGLAHLVPPYVLRFLLNRMLKRATKVIPVDVKLITLSDYFDEQNITRVDLLKVDVEGAEVQVLRGIREEHWPMVQQVALELENHDLRRQVLEILLPRGFHVRVERSAHLPDADPPVTMVYASRDASLTELHTDTEVPWALVQATLSHTAAGANQRQETAAPEELGGGAGDTRSAPGAGGGPRRRARRTEE